jgi:hypothetical protein
MCRSLRLLVPILTAGLLGCGEHAVEGGPAEGSKDGPSFVPGLGPVRDGGQPEVAGVTGDAACAATSVRAERLPLDLYLMLDASYSMFDEAAPGIDKWQAVRTALSSFMMDPRSAGLGLGLQYFPVTRPEVPEDCYDGAACGARGPCLIARTCSPASTVRRCDTADDCAPGQRCLPVGGCERTPELCGEGLPLCPGGATNPCVQIPGYCIQRDVCEVEAYATPAVAIAELPGAAGAITTSLTGKRPEGRTPTGPALAGAIQQAQARQAANPGRRAAVVLASDGLPVVCTPSTIGDVAAIAASAAGATPPVLTFALGVVAAREQAATLRNLGAIASAGGTGRPFVVNTGQNVTQDLLSALDAIRTRALTCEYKLPAPPSGTLDYFRVNVQFTAGNGQVTSIGNVADRTACDATRGGWYYDVPPGAGGGPSSVVICPASCEPLQADDRGQVDIVLGCRTVFID